MKRNVLYSIYILWVGPLLHVVYNIIYDLPDADQRLSSSGGYMAVDYSAAVWVLIGSTKLAGLAMGVVHGSSALEGNLTNLYGYRHQKLISC
ncbi:hypothetical protein QTP88_025774 [Uroleucon formosanum]